MSNSEKLMRQQNVQIMELVLRVIVLVVVVAFLILIFEKIPP